jgi:hypothetical protein
MARFLMCSYGNYNDRHDAKVQLLAVLTGAVMLTLTQRCRVEGDAVGEAARKREGGDYRSTCSDSNEYAVHHGSSTLERGL